MKNSGRCDIENTVMALEQAIENKKIQMHNPPIRSEAASSGVVSHLFSEVLNKAGGSYGQINLALEHGGEFVHNFIKQAQQSVEQKPWEALRKVAVYSFGIGLFLSMRHRKTIDGGRGKKNEKNFMDTFLALGFLCH